MVHAMSEDGRACNVVKIIGFGLFIGAVISLGSAASNDWLASEWWVQKDV